MQDWMQAEPDPRDVAVIYTTQASSFLDACARKDTLLSTLAEARQTLRVNLATLKSSETHSPVTVPNGN